MPDAGFDQLLALLMSFLGPQAEVWAKNILGTPSFGRNILSNDPLKTVAWNAEAAARSRMIQSALGDYTSWGTNIAAQNMRQQYYMLMGETQKRAAELAVEAAGNPLSSIIESVFIKPQFVAAQSAIGSALYSRTALWDWRSPFINDISSTKANNYWDAGGQLFSSILMDATRHGGIMGLGVEDSSRIASEMIRRGGADSYLASDNDKALLNRFKSDLKSYAGSINALKDVLDGPMEEILQAFEKFTGNRMVSMAAGRVATISNTMRNVLMTGNVSAQQIAQMTSQQYGMIAPFGGTLAQASQMALNTAANIAAGVSIEGFSDIEAAQEFSRQNTMRYMNGTQLTIGAAYSRWLRDNKRADSPEAAYAFSLEAKSKGGLLAYAQSIGLTSADMNSPLARAAAANPMLNAMANAQTVMGNYEKILGSSLASLGLDSGTLEQVRLLAKAEYDPLKFQQALRDAGFGGQEKLIMDAVFSARMLATGSANERAAGAVLQTARGGQALAYRDLMASSFRRFGDIASGGGDALQRLSRLITQEPGSELTIGQAILATMGITNIDSAGLNDIASALRSGNPAEIEATLRRRGVGDIGEALNRMSVLKNHADLGAAILASGKGGNGDAGAKKTLIDALSTGSYNIHDIQEAAKQLGLSGRDVDQIILQAGGDKTYSKAEMDDIEKRKEALLNDADWRARMQEYNQEGWADSGYVYMSEARLSELATKQAATESGLAKRVAAVRASLKGDKSDEALRAAIMKNKQLYKDIRDYAGGGEAADKFFKELTTDDSIIGLLRSIFNWLQQNINGGGKK